MNGKGFIEVSGIRNQEVMRRQMGNQGFRELKVWQDAKNLAVEIYKTTDNAKFAKDFGLKNQVQKAAVSIASNIAEGYERNSDKEFVRFLLIAKGSLSELRTQLEIAMEIDYLPGDIFEKIEGRCDLMAGMLSKLARYRINKNKGEE